MTQPSLTITALSQAYETGAASPSQVVTDLSAQIAARGDDGVWISLAGPDRLLERARELESLSADARQALPLFGLPFSVKDCVDVAGWPTTAACPDYSYVPTQTNPAVERLLQAGAILVGKTNLDQFATGLVGVRSPYGIARNPFDPEYIPGGSSSGAAVSVSSGLVSFAIGTDTGGSGRVPASFNNVVGVKPTRGLLSLRGSVGTSRSLDCLSVFARTVADASLVRRIAQGFDAEDPWSRQGDQSPDLGRTFRFAVPAPEFLDFLGDDDNAVLFAQMVHKLVALGGEKVEIDYAPFLEVNDFLFQGPILAERVASCGPFVIGQADSLLPVTRTVLVAATRYDGVQVFQALHRLQALRRQTQRILAATDVLVVPTTPTIWTIAQIEEDPIGRNAALGRYTNFVNFLDMAAIAIPAGFRPNGLPAGITLAGPAFGDDRLAELAGRLHP